MCSLTSPLHCELLSRRSAPLGGHPALTTRADATVQIPVASRNILQIFQPLSAVPAKSCRRNKITLHLEKPTASNVKIRETKTSWDNMT